MPSTVDTKNVGKSAENRADHGLYLAAALQSQQVAEELRDVLKNPLVFPAPSPRRDIAWYLADFVEEYDRLPRAGDIKSWMESELAEQRRTAVARELGRLQDRDLSPYTMDALMDRAREDLEHQAMQTAAKNLASEETVSREDFEDIQEMVEAVSSPSTDGLRADVLTAAEVEPRKIEYLWSRRLPLGVWTMLAGLPERAKSYLITELTARLTTGRPLPGDDGEGEPVSVVLLSAEDSYSHTVRPRLEDQGADLDRVHFFPTELRTGRDETVPFNLADPDHTAELERVVEATDARLVAIDPVTSVLRGTDDHKNTDVRTALQPAVDLAERTDAALLTVKHLRKAQADHALHRIAGSAAFTEGPRSVLLAGRDPTDENNYAVAQIKHNLGPKADPVGYSFSLSGELVLRNDTDLTVTDLLEGDEDAEQQTRRQEAENFLRGALSEGPQPAKDVLSAARSAGISKATLYRARRSLGVETRRKGYQGALEWYRPEEDGEDGDA